MTVKQVTKIFKSSEDMTGRGFERGWLEVEAPSSYFPGGPMTVAHDLLEHKLRPKYGIEEELMAFGAALFIRGDGCYFDDMVNNDWASNIYDELAEMMANYKNNVAYCRSWGLEDYQEEQIKTALILAARFNVKERGVVRPNRKTMSHITNWIRRGYRWAAKRYSVSFPYELCRLFKEVEKSVSKFDPNDTYLIKVSVDLIRLNVRVEEFYPKDESIYW